jgi:ParB/RepB/Spo0J family partition protein
MNYSTLTIDKLVRWEGNPRPQASETVRSELKASIADKGVIMPLIVREKDGSAGIYEVIGGDTRRDIVSELVAEGLWDATREIPVDIRNDLVGDDVAALDIAVSNNIHVPMHPMDQFYAFNQLVEMGRDIQQVANAYGVSQRVVEQRLSYAKLDERARQLVKNDQRDLDWAAAMTMASDEEQDEMLREIENDARRYQSAHEIRRRLDDDLISTSQALFDVTKVNATLVRKDLFDPSGASYMKKSEFVPLQEEALKELVAQRESEGWKKVSVVSHRDFDRYKYNDGVTVKEMGEVIFVRTQSGAIVEHAGLSLRVEERINNISDEDEDIGSALFGETAVEGNEEEIEERKRIARAEITKDPTYLEGRKTKRYIEVSRAVISQAIIMEDPRFAVASTVAGFLMNSAPKLVEGRVFSDLTEMDETNPARVIVERHLDGMRQIMESGNIDLSKPYIEVVMSLLSLDDQQLMTLLKTSLAKRVATDLHRSEMLFEAAMEVSENPLKTYWRPDRAYLETLSKESLDALAKKILPGRLYNKLTGSKSDYIETIAQIVDDAHDDGMRLGEEERNILTSWAPVSLGGVKENENNIFSSDDEEDDEAAAKIFSDAA